MYVPYALYAEKSGSGGSSGDNDTDSTNEIQELNLSGTVLSLSKNGGQVTLPSSGGGDNWGTQYVIVENNLKGKGTTAEPLGIDQMGATEGQILKWEGDSWHPVDDSVNDDDSDPSNELQTLSRDGNKIILSDNGGTFTDMVNDHDTEPDNELQKLTKSGDTISLSDGGGFIIDADSDPNNEIQSLSYSNDTLRLSEDGEVVLSSGAKELNDLNDAKTDDLSIFIGTDSGNNDDGDN
jgi:hypothetical protein